MSLTISEDQDWGSDNILPEYDFTDGKRGKHYKAFREGHSVQVHKADGTTEVHYFALEDGAVMLEPDVRQYFPDSDAVNKTLHEEAVTVVIPTRNEIDFLPRLIHCLEKQTFSKLAIVVVDDHSTDNTRQFCQANGINLIDGGHPGRARNLGAELASTNYVLFLDADVLIQDDFIETVIEYADDLGADLISFEFIPSEKHLLIELLFKLAMYYFRIAELLGFSHGIGGALFVKKEVHDSVNGFDESITVAEDLDYTNRISKMYKYVFLREPRVMVSARRLIREGIIRFCVKWISIELHRILKGEIRENHISYFSREEA
jgi:glycosyltransferase involved in cell wall biosynthesis